MVGSGRRVGTVRLRTTLAATLVVGIALAIGAVTLVAMLRSTLTTEIRAAAQVRASEVVALLESGGRPDQVRIDGVEDSFVQLLDPQGTVVASSRDDDELPRVADLRPGQSTRVVAAGDGEEFLAVAAAASVESAEPGATSGTYTVVVARSLDPVHESSRALTRLLAVGLPALLLVVAVSTWIVTGRALAPVDSLRREVDEISGVALHRRVPEPSGQDEIARLARTMNRMLARLQGSRDRQQRFVADASHELRSPLASIRQHSEVALAHPGRTTAEQLATTVLADSLRIESLVEALLLLARADEHTLLAHARPVDLDDLVFEEAGRLRALGGPEIDTTAVSAGRVVGDAQALRRVLRNLGDNAARHARRRVALALAVRADAVQLTVDDDGPGIAPQDRERVLERFVRLDDARARDVGGSGLGLAIVAELVAAHHGRVRVTDSPLGGARIEVELPSRGDV